MAWARDQKEHTGVVGGQKSGDHGAWAAGGALGVSLAAGGMGSSLPVADIGMGGKT